MSEDDVRRFNVLLENIQTSVKVIAEGHVALNTKLDGFRAEQAETNKAIVAHMGRIEADLHEFKVDTGRELVGIKGRLGRVEKHVGPNGTTPSRPGRGKTSKK